MNKEKTIQILEFYHDIERMIKLNEKNIKDFEEQYYTSASGINMDGLPHGKGRTSSPIERIVMNIPKSISETIQELEKDTERLCKVKVEILKEINCLAFSQRTVIFSFYIHDYQWERISVQIHYSVRQCKNIRNRAIEKLMKKFDTNKLISSYRFPIK